MTQVGELLERLRALDIRLTLDGDRLVVNAPRGALTPALRDELTRCKESVKSFLAANPSAARRVVPVKAVPQLVRVSREGPIPVSHSQQRRWFMKQLDTESSAYNVAGALRFKGDLNEAVLRDSVADLTLRHEGLRTRFSALDGVPVCFVETSVTVDMGHLDVSNLPQPDRESAAMEAAAAIAQRPFDLERAPLLNSLVIRLDADDHIFVFSIDHIVADGVSMSLLLADLQVAYRSRAVGTLPTFAPIAVQYIDYADWERRCFRQGSLDLHRAYWKKQLAGLPGLLALPTDFPRPPVVTSQGAREVVRFAPEIGPMLKQFARAEGVTLFMVLLAGFQVLLHRYSGDSDIVVGSAIANRNRAEVENVVGFFANNLVMRGDLSGDPDVRELLTRIRVMALKAYMHQEMPFDMLVDELATHRALDRSPLFQVMFILQSGRTGTVDLPGCSGVALELPLASARFDLAVDVFDWPDSMRILVEYRTDLFEAATIKRMMGHYERLLQEFVAQPQAKIGALPMLTPGEGEQLLQRWNDTARPDEGAVRTIHGVFEDWVKRSPDAHSLVFEGDAVSYRELNEQANRLARHLRSVGVGTGSLVGVWLERSVQMVVAVLGVMKAGAAYVPLDPSFPQDRLVFMIEDSGLSVVVTQSALAGRLTRPGLQAVCLDADLEQIDRHPADDLGPIATGHDLAYVIYTSGSTGRPKGVMIEHRSVVNFLESMRREPGLAEGDRFVAVTTLSFDIAGLELYGPLCSGATVVLASRASALDGERLGRLLEDSRATVLQATPSTWRLLIDSGWRGRVGLKMLCGGEGLPRDLARKLLDLGGELWNMYGPTETTIWSTLARVTDPSAGVPIGRPIANTQVYVLEPAGQPAPVGVGGELYIAGAGLARGYLNRPELTAEKFVTLDLPGVGPTRAYRTGDVVRWLADGQLEFVGRRDHQVKLRGFRIELEEIEAVLATHPGVRENVVQVREDTPGDQRLVGYVVMDDAAALVEAELRATLRAKLPEYMVPNLLVSLETLPLTPNGKVDRKALPPPRQNTAGASVSDESVMTAMQRQVADSWKRVLQVERVGLHVNFFDLGGHSLLLVRLQSALQKLFGRPIALIDLFHHTTVAAQTEAFAAVPGSDRALARAQARAARQMHG